ncbi:uncharacterized protein LOC107360084 [Tetranychus urticae]|uniref:uncharacterized protein LOC107360084 n=1 Tax=Tetranychus urticae TaxID=32264 RepID=UPI00077B9F45|nr:uncharacterized protein LOC107360084 [Tetranychus urticae]
MNRIILFFISFLLLSSSSIADEIHEKGDSSINGDKNPNSSELSDDDDMIKAESQEDHKNYPPIHQGQFETAPAPNHNYHHSLGPLPPPPPPPPSAPSHSELGPPGPPLPPHHHPMINRPGYMLSNLPPPKGHGNHHGSIYSAHGIPPAHASGHPSAHPPPPPPPPGPGHPVENSIEYGPEAGHPYQGSGYDGQSGPQNVPVAQVAVAPAPHHGSSNGGQQNENWPLPAPDMPKIAHLDVKCEKNLMKVAIEFDKPFNGIIFSKGHYSHGNCVHLPAGSGRNSVYFDIGITTCGTTGNTQNGLYGYGASSGSGTFFENTIVIQYDQQVQEVWDQARKLRCTWHDQYEKSVTFRPFPVDMLDVVRADFAGDNVGCWMQIQVGKGPWASEVAGIVKIGQTMTMVLAIKDEENKFDMLVRNCIAHDGKRAPIELVDSQGCIVRPKLMSKFTKIKNFGSSATVLSYAHFQAFKFPDSMEVHFQCTIQICRHQCPEQCSASTVGGPGSVEALPGSSSSVSSSSSGPSNGPIEGRLGQQQESYVASASSYHGIGKPREERDVSRRLEDMIKSEYSMDAATEIGLNRIIKVVSTSDLAFNLGSNESVPLLDMTDLEPIDQICMSTISFATSVIVLIIILIVSCLISVFLCLYHRSTEKSNKLNNLSMPYEIRTYPSSKCSTLNGLPGR